MREVFSHFIDREKEDSKKRQGFVQWFVDTFPPSEFKQDEFLYWHFLDFCADLNIPVKFTYLQSWISTELRELLHSYQTRVKGCETYAYDDPMSFETIFRITSEVLEDDFKVLESLPSEVADFKVDMSTYMAEMQKAKLTETLASTFEKLNQTDDVLGAAQYCSEHLDMILDIYDPENLQDIDGSDGSDEFWEFVTDSGLPAIDNDSKGIYTTNLVDVSAQPGTGKTRFAIGTYAYRALTVHHKNVLFCALEQGKKEIKAMFIARHVFELFGIVVDSSMIKKNLVPDELKPQVEAAKYDLFESGKYGTLAIEECTFYVETFLKRLDTLDKLKGPFDLIIVDYMGLIDTKPAKYQTPMKEFEVLKRAYRVFKRWLRKRRKAGISVTQFTKEGTQAGRADKEITADMLQGGMAASRNIDYGVGISATASMELQNKRRLSNTKKRDSAGFPDFIADVRLGFCWFRQVVQKAEY